MARKSKRPEVSPELQARITAVIQAFVDLARQDAKESNGIAPLRLIMWFRPEQVHWWMEWAMLLMHDQMDLVVEDMSKVINAPQTE